MAQNPQLQNLSDFGLASPGASNSTAPTSSPGQLDLKTLLGGVMDDVGKANMIEQQIQQLGQENPGFMDLLKSPQILGLLGSVAAGGLMGGKEGAALGGLGGLQGFGQVVEGRRAANTAAIEQLTKQHGEALDRIDKSQTRYASLINANPDIMTDPETGQPSVSPEVIGFLATGSPIPLYPHSRRIQSQRQGRWESRHELLTDALKDSNSVEDSRVLVKAVLQNSGWDAPADVVESLANAKGTPDFNNTFAKIMLDNAGADAYQAFIQAAERGVEITDPEIMKLIKWNPEVDKDIDDVTKVDDALLAEGFEMVHNWQKDPANRAKLKEIVSTSPTIDEKNRRIANEALGARSDILATYMHKLSLSDDKTFEGVMAAYGPTRDAHALADNVAGFETMPARMAMTDAEKIADDLDRAGKLYGETRKAAVADRAKEDAAVANQLGTRISKANLGLNPEQIQVLITQLINDATDQAGKVDQKELERLTQKAIADIRGSE